MKTERFGSKFFCGKLVTPYPEPPLHYLQGKYVISWLSTNAWGGWGCGWVGGAERAAWATTLLETNIFKGFGTLTSSSYI